MQKSLVEVISWIIIVVLILTLIACDLNSDEPSDLTYSSDAALSALVLSPVNIDSFASGTKTYSILTQNSVNTIDIVATANDPNSSITVNGSLVSSGQSINVAMSVGSNPVEIVITAEEEVTVETYSVTVTRSEPYLNQLYILESDADTPGTDDAEFVEIWNNTGSEIDFATTKYFLLLINGGDDWTYEVVQMTGTLASDSIHVIGPVSMIESDDNFTGSVDQLQNGADGLMLVRCDDATDAATDFPDNTTVASGTFTTGSGKTATVIDSLAYDTDDIDDTGLMAALGVSYQWNENMNGLQQTESLRRFNKDTWTAGTPTPGTK